jgi:hypothetical protein
LGHVFMDEVIGRQNLITYAVGIDADGALRNLEIMAYRESHGGEVRNPAWREQFNGRSSLDQLRFRTDIKNISGATLSSEHVTEGVRWLVALWQALRGDPGARTRPYDASCALVADPAQLDLRHHRLSVVDRMRMADPRSILHAARTVRADPSSMGITVAAGAWCDSNTQHVLARLDQRASRVPLVARRCATLERGRLGSVHGDFGGERLCAVLPDGRPMVALLGREP